MRGRYKPLDDKQRHSARDRRGRHRRRHCRRFAPAACDATISQNLIRRVAPPSRCNSSRITPRKKDDSRRTDAWPTLLIDKSNIDPDATKKYGLWSEEVKQ